MIRLCVALPVLALLAGCAHNQVASGDDQTVKDDQSPAQLSEKNRAGNAGASPGAEEVGGYDRALRAQIPS